MRVSVRVRVSVMCQHAGTIIVMCMNLQFCKIITTQIRPYYYGAINIDNVQPMVNECRILRANALKTYMYS